MAIFCLFLWLSTVGSAHAATFGIRAPVKSFMWKKGESIEDARLNEKLQTKWKVAAENIRQIPKWGGQWNILVIRQWRSQDRDLLRLNAIIDEHESHGVHVVLRILEDPGIYDRVLSEESPEFGYDKAYFDWVQSLIQAVRGRVDCVLIGNETEIDFGQRFSGDRHKSRQQTLKYGDYAKVLTTAVKAVDSVDKSIRVANSGFSDSSMAVVMARQIYLKHGIDQAHEFWKSWKERDGFKVESTFRLRALLNSDDVKRRSEFIHQALRDPMGGDLFQLHYYRNWRALQPMLTWLQEEMTLADAVRPIIAAEIGYRVPVKKQKAEDGRVRKVLDVSRYSEDDHSANLVKIFATLLGNGVTDALYWNMRNTDDYGAVMPMFHSTDDPNEFEATAAARAFRYLSNTLGGLSVQAGRLEARFGLTEFRFSGDVDVSLLWSENEDLCGQLSAAEYVTDIVGHAVNVSNCHRVLTGPIYSFWLKESVARK